MSETNNLKPVTKVAIVLVIGLLALGLGAQLIQPVRAVTLVADFSASPSPALPGALVTFTSTFSGGTAPFSFAWNFNDTTSATGNPATHSFTLPAPPAPRDFNVSLTVTDSSAPPQVVKVAHIITITNLEVGINCGLGSREGIAITVTHGPGETAPPPPISGDHNLQTTCTWAGDANTQIAPDPVVCPGLGCTSEPLVSDLPEGFPVPNYGGGFNVEVRVLNLNATLGGPDKIDGFDATVAFNPHILSAVSFDQVGLVFDPNSPPPGSGGISKLANVIDNNIGTARLAQTILGVSTGGDTQGGLTLFRVRFDVVGVGISPLTLQNDQVTRPSIVPHASQSASFDAQSFWDPSALGLAWTASWSFSPNPEIAGSPITFTATASCLTCTLPLTFRWDFGSRNNGTFDATGASVTIPTPPTGFAISRVILNITDSAATPNEVAAVRRLPLVVATATGPATLAKGTAGTFAETWVGGITPYTATWRFCPGSTSPSELRVCNAPTSTTGGIAQSSSVPVTYNFAGVFTNTITVKDTAAGGYSGGIVSQTILTTVTGTPAAYTVTTRSNSTNAPVNTPVKISATMAYDSTYPAYSKAADTVVNGTAPAFGTSLKTDPKIKFCDTIAVGGNCVSTGNGVWGPTEWVFYDTANSGIAANAVVLYQGSAPRPTGTLSTRDTHFRFIGALATFTQGNQVIYDVNANGIYDASFQASFNFGDGSATTTITGGFTINATHTYTTANTYTVSVSVTEFSITAPSKIGETGTLSQVIVPPVTFNYSLSVAPTTVNLVQGTTSSASTVSALLVAGTSQAVTLSISGLPTGVTASAFTPNPVSPASPAATSTFTLTAASTAPVVSGVTVTITGTSTGGVVRTTTFTLNVVASFNYSLSVAPTSVSVVQGTTSAPSTVSALLVATGAGVQTVTLSLSGLPTGVTASAFTPNPVTPASPAATSTFTLTAAATAPVVSGVTVTITGSPLSKTTTFTLNVVASFDYSLSVAPTTVTLVQGTTSSASTVSALLVAAGSGAQAVTLSISGLPTGVTASAFTPNPVTPASPASTSTFTLTATATAPVVSGVIVTITGTSTGGVVRTTTFTLSVVASFDYSLSVAPGSVTLVQGTTSSASTVSALLVATGAGVQTVTLSISGLPTGVTASVF